MGYGGIEGPGRTGRHKALTAQVPGPPLQTFGATALIRVSYQSHCQSYWTLCAGQPHASAIVAPSHPLRNDRSRAMQRFKNILVCHSQRIGDEAALSRATALAKANEARLSVLEVIEKVPELAETERDPVLAHDHTLPASATSNDEKLRKFSILIRDKNMGWPM